MKLSHGFLLLCVLVVFGCAAQIQSQPLSQQPDTFIEQLQRGGYVIFFRHAATDHTQEDTDKKNLANCDTQRRLNELGKQQAKEIGEGFKALDIPVGDVFTSYYCRCINTANIAFGKATPTMDITSIQEVTPEVRRQRIDNLRKLLATEPKPDTNTILVAHQWMFKDASGIFLEEGEAAIFKPQAYGTAHFIRQVKAHEWKTLQK